MLTGLHRGTEHRLQGLYGRPDATRSSLSARLSRIFPSHLLGRAGHNVMLSQRFRFACPDAVRGRRVVKRNGLAVQTSSRAFTSDGQGFVLANGRQS